MICRTWRPLGCVLQNGRYERRFTKDLMIIYISTLFGYFPQDALAQMYLIKRWLTILRSSADFYKVERYKAIKHFIGKGAAIVGCRTKRAMQLPQRQLLVDCAGRAARPWRAGGHLAGSWLYWYIWCILYCVCAVCFEKRGISLLNCYKEKKKNYGINE